MSGTPVGPTAVTGMEPPPQDAAEEPSPVYQVTLTPEAEKHWRRDVPRHLEQDHRNFINAPVGTRTEFFRCLLRRKRTVR